MYMRFGARAHQVNDEKGRRSCSSGKFNESYFFFSERISIATAPFCYRFAICFVHDIQGHRGTAWRFKRGREDATRVRGGHCNADARVRPYNVFRP